MEIGGSDVVEVVFTADIMLFIVELANSEIVVKIVSLFSVPFVKMPSVGIEPFCIALIIDELVVSTIIPNIAVTFEFVTSLIVTFTGFNPTMSVEFNKFTFSVLLIIVVSAIVASLVDTKLVTASVMRFFTVSVTVVSCVVIVDGVTGIEALVNLNGGTGFGGT